MAAEPAFAKSHVWPPPGAMPLEPDDPRIVFPMNGGSAREAAVIVDQATEVSVVAQEPLGPKPQTTARQKFWRAAIASSVTLHVAVAAFFLTTGNDEAQVAGAEDAGITFLGNAPEDQLSSGQPMVEAMAEVTIIDVAEVKQVEATEAETIPAEPVAEATETLTAEPAERIESVEERAVVAELPEEPAPSPTETTPEALATDKVEPVEDDNVVRPEVVAPVEPVAEPEGVAEMVAEPEPDSPPLPDTVETVPTQRPKPEEPTAATAKEPKEKPAKPKTAKGAAGSGGKNVADAAKGQADGRDEGTAKSKASGKAAEKAAGNAAVSNYPGKVRSKVQRSVRKGRGKGQVVVSFTVSSSGSVSGVRVSKSSGKSDLDRAAMDAVRLAAPFPPIPDGRRSWAFSVPIAFR